MIFIFGFGYHLSHCVFLLGVKIQKRILRFYQYLSPSIHSVILLNTYVLTLKVRVPSNDYIYNNLQNVLHAQFLWLTFSWHAFLSSVVEFNSRIVGLTGPVGAIRQMAQEYRVFFKKVEEEGDDYLVESSHNM